MPLPHKEHEAIPPRRAARAVAQVLLLVVMVPVGISWGWLTLSPTPQKLAERAAGGGDSAALLELVQRAAGHSHAAEELQTLLGRDEGSRRALVNLAKGHEEALVQLISMARNRPECVGHLAGVQMSFPFAEALLRHMEPSGMQTLQEQAQTSADAAFVLGVAYERGLHAPQSWAQAACWYEAATRQGLEQAASYYALAAYEAGLQCCGAASRKAEAAAWFRAAAEQGHAAAQCALGVCYSTAAGVPLDLTQAVAWYEKSASQGYVDGMFNMGWCLLDGQGTEKNTERAAAWFQKAAHLGDALAQYYVGQLYQSGEGLPQNAELAVRWYTRSANLGCNLARWALAACYEKGIGVPRCARTAQYWQQLAEKDSQTATDHSEL